MALAQRKVLLLAADDFEDMELLYPLYRLAEEGVAVTVAGLDDHPLRGKKGYGPLAVDTTVDEVAEELMHSAPAGPNRPRSEAPAE